MRSLFIYLALFAACAPASNRNCHKSSKADGVGPDGELHYPEVCTASTTPAAVAPGPRRAAPAVVATGPLAALRPDTPEPCREYARDRCAAKDGCDDALKLANQLTAKKRAYAQCMKLQAKN